VIGILAIFAFGNTVWAGGVRLLGEKITPENGLETVRSSVSTDATTVQEGKPSIRWHGVKYQSRVEFLLARNVDFGKFDRISLWLHSGNLQGESLTLLATDNNQTFESHFYYCLHLTWEGWYRAEIPLIRFSHTGSLRWPQAKYLYVEYGGRKSDRQMYLGEVRLLAPGEVAEPEPQEAPVKVDTRGEKLMITDFEKGAESFVWWVPRNSGAEISVSTIKSGEKALRWYDLKEGASLEYLKGPISLRGYNRFAAWIFVTRPLKKGLYVAYGNDRKRVAFKEIGALEPGWNQVVLPLSKFTSRGEISDMYVDHLMFLYEGDVDVTVIFDDICFIAPEGPAIPGQQPPRDVPPDRPPVDQPPASDFVVAGDGSEARAQPSGSKAARTSQAWYMREGRSTIRWFDLQDCAELVFRNVPSDPFVYKEIEAWIYADNPTGVLEVLLLGGRGEASTEIEVNWIGWKCVKVDISRLRGAHTLRTWEELMFRFEGKKENLREFCFDGIRVIKK
jgi:hypothetical protein